MTQWEIIDNKSTIFSGTEEEMREQLRRIENGDCILDDAEGDLKLVQVHAITRQYRRS